MKLITMAHLKALHRNWKRRYKDGHDPKPVVKLFLPSGPQTWLITEMDPEDNDTMFGLCDLGFGFPELGKVSLNELRRVRGAIRFAGGRTYRGIRIERDKWFRPSNPLSHYTQQAREKGRIEA